jgi:hypothetical protein
VADPPHIWPSLREPTEPSRRVGLALVLGASAVYAWLNVRNASTGTPQWGQDLAFFQQWIHSAATGGPWASPLILEPQGFFSQVHTHLVMPLVVGLYALFPTQPTLLIFHSACVALAIWPALQLGHATGGRRHGLIAVAAVLAFGPFQAVAVADFRPVGLFVPGILGIWAAAWSGNTRGMVIWAAVALIGRQEASYLLVSSGLALLCATWGQARARHALILTAIGGVSWALFAALKPEMFFHINPLAPTSFPVSPELWAQRAGFGIALMASMWWLGILRPAPLIAMIPVAWGMLSTGREWHSLTGPGAHHHAFWLPFVLAAGIAGSARVRRGLGPLLLLVGGSLAFPWAGRTQRDLSLDKLVEAIPATAAVAADYDTIHLLAGRPVLWNVEQLYMTDRPWHWDKPWPITVDDVEWVLAPAGHRIEPQLRDWHLVQATGSHRLFRR